MEDYQAAEEVTAGSATEGWRPRALAAEGHAVLPGKAWLPTSFS